MIDKRKALPRGTVLDFQGIECELGEEIGRGSNALVYQGSYRDAAEADRMHRVLVKELFPLHEHGKIYRKEDNSICVEEEGRETFQIHQRSFEAGNRAHLTLLETSPDQVGANLNTYRLNNTLYTVLGVSGGNSLDKEQPGPAHSLRKCANRMLAILDALEAFHKNGLAHLDIAPDNILLLGKGNRERSLLIDYNSCMALGDIAEQEESGIFSVKMGYTAPEIRSARIRDIGFASDMYSVTAVFYRLLSGTVLTNFQMIRPGPPDVSECPCVRKETDTVKIWVREILRRGLQTLPERRYQNTGQMRRDLEELIDRIDGVGITHWALWETGRSQVERLVRENPSLAFIRDSSGLFPSLVSDGEKTSPTDEYFRKMDGSCMLLAAGGMGKTTAMLRSFFSGNTHYDPSRPAVMYLSLYGWQKGNTSYIVNSILDGMHFDSQTHTYEDARKALYEILERSLGSETGIIPALVLMLDGLNEVTGDIQPLLDEINHLSSMKGVRLVIASRQEESAVPFSRLHLAELSDEVVREALSQAGLLLPESMKMREALRTPMMLSMFIRSARMEGKQIRAGSGDELLKEYIGGLKQKAIHDLPDETDRRWQVEAAVEFVLPAIAAEIHKKQHALSNREMLHVVERCYHLLNGRLSINFFPEWIGHTASIRGNAKNAEEWYGQITHEILWKQLGLLLRNEAGSYVISHQVIENYLLDLNRGNRKKVRKYYGIRAFIAVICLSLVLSLSYQVYTTRQLREAQKREAAALLASSAEQLQQGDRRKAIDLIKAANQFKTDDEELDVQSEQLLSKALYQFQNTGTKLDYQLQINSDAAAVSMSADGTYIGILAIYGNLNCYETKNGELVWTSKSPYKSGQLRIDEDKRCIYCFGTRGYCIFSLETGELLLEKNYRRFTCISSPVASSDNLNMVLVKYRNPVNQNQISSLNIQILRLNDGEEISSISLTDTVSDLNLSVLAASISADEKYAAIVYRENALFNLLVFDIDKQNMIYQMSVDSILEQQRSETTEFLPSMIFTQENQIILCVQEIGKISDMPIHQVTNDGVYHVFYNTITRYCQGIHLVNFFNKEVSSWAYPINDDIKRSDKSPVLIYSDEYLLTAWGNMISLYNISGKFIAFEPFDHFITDIFWKNDAKKEFIAITEDGLIIHGKPDNDGKSLNLSEMPAEQLIIDINRGKKPTAEIVMISHSTGDQPCYAAIFSDSLSDLFVFNYEESTGRPFIRYSSGMNFLPEGDRKFIPEEYLINGLPVLSS